ncbi:MAG: hypothetical protein AB7M05_03190 [Alphaproteobacteria bacterium]
MTVELAKRTRLSLVGVSVLFLFIFSGLFCGFLIAHFFPEQVIRVIYSVGTESPPVQKESDRAEAATVQSAGDGNEGEGQRERDLSVSFQLQSAIELSSLPQIEIKPAQTVENFPRFAKRRKPSPPGADVPPPAAPVSPAVSSAPAAPTTSAEPEQGGSSYLPAAQYPAAEWRRIESQAGYVDSVTIASTGAKLSDSVLKATDTLNVSGWVGDPALGLRFKDVVFAVCGKIVGHTKVGTPRPDVAKIVHPHLTPSGWQAKLYVGYLPRCPGASLLVFGVVPGSMTVVTVGDPVPLKLPAAEKLPANAPKGATLFTPRNVSAARFTSVDVLTDNAELRRCGASNCATVGQVSKGRYQGHIAEEADGWVLLILSDKAGWLPRSQVTWAR